MEPDLEKGALSSETTKAPSAEEKTHAVADEKAKKSDISLDAGKADSIAADDHVDTDKIPSSPAQVGKLANSPKPPSVASNHDSDRASPAPISEISWRPRRRRRRRRRSGSPLPTRNAVAREQFQLISNPVAADFDGVAPEHVQDFRDLVASTESSIASGPARARHSKARDALKRLYQINIGRRRVPLFRHYMRLVENDHAAALEEFSTSPAAVTEDVELERDLERYSKATAEYESFMRFHDSRGRWSSDLYLIEVAARLNAIAKLEAKQRINKDDNNSVNYQPLIDHAKQRLAKYCHAVAVLGSDDAFSTGAALLGLVERVDTTFLDPEAAKRKEKAAQDAREAEIQRKEIVRQRKRYWSNLKMALFGGFALIVPMLIMTLHQTQLTTLLTTSIFVLVVAMILSLVMSTAEPKDVVGATAAYAAVLVVFVGTGAGSGAATASGGTASNGGSHSSRLSGGAIAGIVVGCIVGVILMLLLLCCCCFKGLTDGLLAVFGIGRKRRLTEGVVLEHRDRRQSRRWYGGSQRRRQPETDVFYGSDYDSDTSISETDSDLGR